MSSGSVDARVLLACFLRLAPSMKLERPSRSPSALTSFLGTWAWVVVLLAVAVVLVSLGGASYLVELGRVAYVRFSSVSPENCDVDFSCRVFL
jgi:hypothetical protein